VVLLQHPQQQTLQQPQQQMLQQLSPFTVQSGAASNTSQMHPVAATAAATAGMLSPTPSLPLALPAMSEVANTVSMMTSRVDNSSSCCTSMDLGSLSQQLQQQQQQPFQQHCSGDLDSSATSWQSTLPGITSVPCSSTVTNGLSSADASAQQLLLLQQQQQMLQTGSAAAAGSVFAAPGSSSGIQYQPAGDQRQELLLQLEQLQQRQLQQRQLQQQQQQSQACTTSSSAAAVDAEIARLLQLRQRLVGQLQAAPAFASTVAEGVYMSGVANQAGVVQQPQLMQYNGTAAVQQYNSTMPQQYGNAPQQYGNAPQFNSTAQFGGAAVLAGNPANTVNYVPAPSVCVQPYAVGGQPAAAAAGQVMLQGSMQQTAVGWMQLLPM
jgi:hypothetical protein